MCSTGTGTRVGGRAPLYGKSSRARKAAKRLRAKLGKQARVLETKVALGTASPFPDAMRRVQLVEGGSIYATVVPHKSYYTNGAKVAWVRGSERTKAIAHQLLDQVAPILARTRNAAGPGGCRCKKDATGMCPRHLSVLQSGTDSEGYPVFLETSDHGNSYISTNHAVLTPIVKEAILNLTPLEVETGCHPSQRKHATEACRLLRTAALVSGHVFVKDSDQRCMQELHTDAPMLEATADAAALLASRGLGLSDRYTSMLAAGHLPLRVHHGAKGSDSLSVNSGFLLELAPGDIVFFCSRSVVHSGAYLPGTPPGLRVSASLECGPPTGTVQLVHSEELAHKLASGKHGMGEASVETTGRVRAEQAKQCIGWRQVVAAGGGVARSSDWTPVPESRANPPRRRVPGLTACVVFKAAQTPSSWLRRSACLQFCEIGHRPNEHAHAPRGTRFARAPGHGTWLSAGRSAAAGSARREQTRG